MELSLSQKFELERMKRTIDECQDVEALRRLAKQLVSAWASQKAASEHFMRQAMGSAPQAEWAKNDKV
jgi:hypothetical protein